MNLESRVGQLERAAGGDGELCRCQLGTDVRKYSGEASKQDAERDTAPAQLCIFCGRPKLVVKVVYTKHWRREEALGMGGNER